MPNELLVKGPLGDPRVGRVSLHVQRLIAEFEAGTEHHELIHLLAGVDYGPPPGRNIGRPPARLLAPKGRMP